MPKPLRFCIRSVTPEQRALLLSLHPPALPRDCLARCTDCFFAPCLARGDRPLDPQEAAAILSATPPSPTKQST